MRISKNWGGYSLSRVSSQPVQRYRGGHRKAEVEWKKFASLERKWSSDLDGLGHRGVC